ncbi:MAG: carbon storage regulator CsrA [Candidatus Komeilibacteria bacterium]|jgi:carbon storage regulator|nr:carbon storage regulator CsrA [Candidatus Komeilibacteria bacterium]
MLILARKIDEVIMIGNNVSITIADIKSSQVQIGITAPKEVPVHRYEIWRDIQNAEKNLALPQRSKN